MEGLFFAAQSAWTCANALRQLPSGSSTCSKKVQKVTATVNMRLRLFDSGGRLEHTQPGGQRTAQKHVEFRKTTAIHLAGLPRELGTR